MATLTYREMTLTKTIENKEECPKFIDGCSAPLCPVDTDSVEGGIWYSDGEICRRRDFQNLDWIKRQRQIAKLKVTKDKYFTVPMLQAIKQVRKGIQGINPDQLLEETKKAERKWIAEKKGGRVIAKQNPKTPRVIAEEKDNLALASNTSHREEEVKNQL